MLISALTGTITHGSNDWLVDSGVSKHMMRYKESFVNMYEHESPHKVKLGDDYQYTIKESGECNTPVLTPLVLNYMIHIL